MLSVWSLYVSFLHWKQAQVLIWWVLFLICTDRIAKCKTLLALCISPWALNCDQTWPYLFVLHPVKSNPFSSGWKMKKKTFLFILSFAHCGSTIRNEPLRKRSFSLMFTVNQTILTLSLSWLRSLGVNDVQTLLNLCSVHQRSQNNNLIFSLPSFSYIQ